MMKISKYTKLGLLVITCLTILVWGINYLKGIDIFRSNARYYVIYDKIDGLLESSPVNINGYQVGQVTEIKFLNDYSGRLIATLSLSGDFKIGKGSVAKIVSSDIMGTKSVKMEIVRSTEYYKENDTIPGAIESDLKEQVSMQVLPIKAKAEQLMASLDSAITVFTSVFNKNTRENLSQSFENINNTIAHIESVSAELDKIFGTGKINSIVENLDSISGSVTKNSGNVTRIVSNLSSLSDTLSTLNLTPVFNDVKSSVAGLNTVLQKLNSDENSAGLLMNDKALYQNLNNVANSLDLLLQDVRNNPKRYVHFSAVDASKDIFITSRPEQMEAKKDVTFKVHLLKSSAKLSTESDIFKSLDTIEEKANGNSFDYYAGNTSDFNKITTLLNTAKVKFPDAKVEAYKNGKKIKLTKAIGK
jgi:phospholipid/cholesterol/gamma-HCH transport system substrate-binding protein